MHWIDYSVVAGLLAIICFVALLAKKYTRTVADFLAANRCAGRYLISVADGIAGAGLINFIAWFEMIYLAGFITSWWIMVNVPLQLMLALGGWIIYRFRQTRALTMAQFFEMRYSKKFRVFAGLIGFLSGIINFGIFPAVGTQFLMYYCGFPQTIEIAGFAASTYAVVMLILLLIALFFIFVGGQIAIILTDFVQGVFCNIVFMILVGVFLYYIDFSKIISTLALRPQGESLLNPFHTDNVKDFNVWYFAIGAVGVMYNWMGWQGNSASNSSAKSAHEARMAKILGMARVGIAQHILVVLVPVCAYVIMHNVEFGSQAAGAQAMLNGIENPKTQLQMTSPIAIKQLLPIGLVGAFCAVLVAAFVGACDAALHSWGSIFIQDVVLPFRKTPFTQKQHMWLLKGSILGVAVFVYCFSLLFNQTQHIQMYFALTGAIFLGGSGSVIIGGLYWKKGTTSAAWSSMIVGSSLAVSGVIIHQCLPGFFINGQWMYLMAILASVGTYVIVSLCTNNREFDMDKLFHRGKYAIAGESVEGSVKPVHKFAQRLGITQEFSKFDKWIYFGILGWAITWLLIFVVGTVYNLSHEVSDQAWGRFWHVYVWIYFVVGVGIVIWLTIGGVIDMKKLFAALGSVRLDSTDDGTVCSQPNPAKAQKEVIV